jgi:hypothetical protein
LCWLLLAPLLLAVACSQGGERPRDTTNAVVTLLRTECFGSCPAYKVTIEGDGTVTYEGRAFVAVEGLQTAQIDPEEVRELVDGFYDIDYFSLQDRYECPVTDLPTAVTALSIGEDSKNVSDYGLGYGDASCAAPQELVELEERIDEVAGSARWVEGSP